MIIRRDKYLNALVERKHNGLVKVVTGIRRCGKSYLMFNLFREHLREVGVPDDHVIAIQLDLRSARNLRDPDAILDFIYGKIEDSGMHYVLLDEVQLLRDFVEVLNELLANPFVDTYVTGSNSKFLSKDIITEFRGRGDEIHIFPLTFAEFMQTRNDDVLHAWADYVEYGGLPLVASMSSEEQKATYLSNLFEETYIKDIVDLSAITSNLHMHCPTRANGSRNPRRFGV